MRNPVFEIIHAPRQADRTKVCDIHGEYTSHHIMLRSWTQCPTCTKAATAKIKDRLLEAEKSDRDARWSRQLGDSCIPMRFQDRTLSRFAAENAGQQYALEFSTVYAEEFERGHSGRCAVFIGEPGTGKTHLACGIALQAMAYGASALFTTVSKLARRVREAKSFDADETESAAIRIFVYPDLLIVDEVGVQSGTDAEARALFDVINDRYEQRKPTIFLSNLDIGGVQAALGARVFDRMREDGGEVVSFTWGSHRGRIAA